MVAPGRRIRPNGSEDDPSHSGEVQSGLRTLKEHVVFGLWLHLADESLRAGIGSYRQRVKPCFCTQLQRILFDPVPGPALSKPSR